MAAPRKASRRAAVGRPSFAPAAVAARAPAAHATRQQSSACTEGDRDEASPWSPQACKTLLDIRYASHDGQLFLTDLEDIGLLGRFESDGAHFLLVPPQRRSQIDVDGD